MSSRVPEAKYEYHHRERMQIRFNDIDMLGHLNNSVYLQFMDLGKAGYFRQFTGGRFEHDTVGLVIANINCNFFAPTYLEEKLDVLTAVESLSTRSLVMDQRVVNRETGEVKCEARTVMVNVDPNTGHPVPITDEWRRRLCDYEGREL